MTPAASRRLALARSVLGVARGETFRIDDAGLERLASAFVAKVRRRFG